MSHQTALKTVNPIFKNGKVFVTYGYMDPNYGGNHYGADCIPCKAYVDCDVIAIEDGVVEYVKSSVPGTVGSINHADALGNNIKIKHNNMFMTRYCHLKYSSIRVKAGDSVKKGDIIATMGNTGYSFGAHVHFEIHKNGVRVDPEPYITGESCISGINAPDKTAVAVAALNLRESAGTGSKVNAVIPKCGKVEFLDSYTWHCVNYGKEAGYVAANYLKPVSNDTVRTTDSLNFRRTAGTNGKYISTIPANTILTRADNHSWRRVAYNGISGWVDAGFIEYSNLT